MEKAPSHRGRTTLVLLGLVGWMSAPSLAQAAAPVEEDSAQAVIERVLTALGGRAAIAELRSLAVEADCTGPGGSFQTRVDSFRPDAVHFRQEADGRVTEVWSTTERTWRLDAEAAADDLGPSVRGFVRDHEFHLLLFEVETRFSGHRLAGEREVDGRSCRVVEMEDAAGQAASLCVGTVDSLPMELELNPAGAQGTLRIRFGDWREVQGILYFHSFVLAEGEDRSFTYAYERIEPNAVAADRFVAPVPVELKAAQEKLLEILRRDRHAHLTTDAGLLASHLADPLVEVYGGQMSVRPRAEVESFFRDYFSGASYELWEDARPPVVRLSEDGKMAWVVRTVRAHRVELSAGGEPVGRTFTSAYTATYELQDGEWKMTSVTSTFLPA